MDGYSYNLVRVVLSVFNVLDGKKQTACKKNHKKSVTVKTVCGHTKICNLITVFLATNEQFAAVYL